MKEIHGEPTVGPCTKVWTIDHRSKVEEIDKAKNSTLKRCICEIIKKEMIKSYC